MIKPLKTCPFCGGPGVLETDDILRVWCPDCGTMWRGPTAELAIAGWNTRTSARGCWTGKAELPFDMAAIIAKARIEEKRIDLHDTDLHNTDLHNIDLHGVDLRGANLRGADMSDTDLIGANMKGSDLSGAILRWTNLTDAILTDAILTDANLVGANLSGAVGPFSTFSGGRHHCTATPTHIAIGCNRYTHAYWREHYVEIGKENGYTKNEIARYGAWIFSLDWLIALGVK